MMQQSVAEKWSILHKTQAVAEKCPSLTMSAMAVVARVERFAIALLGEHNSIRTWR